MPFIVVYNLLEDDFKETRVEGIKKFIKAAVVGISELKLVPDDIIFSFPKDSTVVSNMTPVMITVELLFEKLEITDKIKQCLKQEIKKAFKSAITWRTVNKVEVTISKVF